MSFEGVLPSPPEKFPDAAVFGPRHSELHLHGPEEGAGQVPGLSVPWSSSSPASVASARADAIGRVELQGVSVRFGSAGKKFAAVEDVSFAIEPGEFVALLGPSGCGKSTLLNVIAGFRAPDSGRALLDGARIIAPDRRRAVVFQQHSLFPWMTALGNVAFGPEMAGESDARDRALRVLDQVGLGDHAHKYPAQLSGGQQQRVGLARALANRPEVLLLDEPFGALDSMTRTLMQELLIKLWEEERHTTLFITHDLDEAIFLADRVAVMGGRPGRIRSWIEVTLPRPRTPEMRTGEIFQRLRREAAALIREESLKAFGQGHPAGRAGEVSP